ncbi:MAG: hypothetical protein HYZ92_05575 [Candidatus Omnitrophica bacterium]|nr:hypothetical protein [Candidatus Omnitrophota bacterium]
MIQTETQIGWQDYVAIISRRRWYFLVPCLLIVSVALVVGSFMPRIYRAETIILVQEPNIMNPLIQGLAVSTPVQQRLRTLREEILSWTSLSRLVHDLKWDQRLSNPLAFEQLIKRLQRDIRVRMSGPDLILMSYEHHNPQLSQKLINTISSIFLERHLAEQSAETNTAIEFLEREMATHKKKLEDSEAALREFRELYVTQMPVAVELNDSIVRLQIALAQMLIENTEEHPAVIDVKRRITDLKIKRNEEIKRFVAQSIAKGQDPAMHQGLIKLLGGESVAGIDPQTAKAAQEAYASWVKRLDNPTPPQPAMAAAPSAPSPAEPPALPGESRAVESSPAPSLASAEDPVSISLGPWQLQELARLNRDHEVTEKTYEHLQERFERAKITQRLGESDEGIKFKVLEPARLPLRPVKPNMLKIAIFSLVMGLFVGAGVAFVAEYLDQSFQSGEELQGELALPVLGTISTIMTEQDLRQRRARWKQWLSAKAHLAAVRTHVAAPIGRRVDALLMRWKI